MKLSEIFETKTKTKVDTKVDTDTIFKTDKDYPIGKTKEKSEPEEKAKEKTKELPKAVSAEKTATASKNVSLPGEAAGYFKNLFKNIPDKVEVKPTSSTDLVKVKSTNLPAHLNKALTKVGEVSPDWHTVSNLPGNAAKAIRSLGKQLFGSFTKTNTDDISMIGNLGGGPNTTKEVNSVAAYLKKHGTNLGPGEIDFDKIMPGYKAELHQYSIFGARFLLVKDFAGIYIYAWPEQDSKDKAPKLEAFSLPRLERKMITEMGIFGKTVRILKNISGADAKFAGKTGKIVNIDLDIHQYLIDFGGNKEWINSKNIEGVKY